VPRAIIEYKARETSISLRSANAATLINLADRAAVAFFVVIYDKVKITFGVLPATDLAHKLHPERRAYSERQYISFSHDIRKAVA
jgi:hypothetical protein